MGPVPEVETKIDQVTPTVEWGQTGRTDQGARPVQWQGIPLLGWPPPAEVSSQSMNPVPEEKTKIDQVAPTVESVQSGRTDQGARPVQCQEVFRQTTPQHLA